MEKAYTTHLRDCTVARGAEILAAAGLKGIALAANEHWCTLVLARSTDERGRLALLASHNPAGVLLIDLGGVGTRLWWQHRELSRLDLGTLQDWVSAELVPSELAPSIRERGLEDTDWALMLRLPEPWPVTDRVLQQPFVAVVGAVPVGLDIQVAVPAPRPVMPSDPSQLFAMLLATGSLEVTPDSAGLAEGFGELVTGGADGAAVLAWLMEQPGVEEVYVGDAALQLILDSMRASYS